MNLKVSKDIESLSHYFADWLVNYINEVLSKQDRFTIALAGGNTPRKLYQLLASDDYREKVDWERMHFFWGDERYVSITDDRSLSLIHISEPTRLLSISYAVFC